MSSAVDAQTLIDELAAINPDAVQLAVMVSLASRIEPELLRSARLEMLSSADASAEADLWLSSLISSRSTLFAVMRPTVADTLREQLCAEPQRLAAAWRVLTRIHEHAPPALRTEEEITWRVLANPEDPEIGRLFESVLVAMEDGRVGLAKWAARALPRMPAQARQSGGAWRVAQKATEVLGGQPILGAELTRAPILDVSSPFSIENLPMVTVGLRLFEDALRISEPPEDHAERIEIPRTTPLLFEVEWQQNEKTERRTVSFGPGSTQLVRPIDSATLRITTAARDVHTVRFLAEGWQPEKFTAMALRDGLAVRAYRGDGAVLLAFDLETSQTKNLAGFAVRRRGPDGAQTPLINPVGGRGLRSFGISSREVPIQRFRFLDRLSSDAAGQYSYTVSAVHHARQQLAAGPEAEVAIDVTPPLGAIEVGFTRGMFLAGTGPLKPGPHLLDYDTGPYAERYRTLGGSAYRMISEFIAAALADSRSTVDVFAFDFDHPDILKSFMALGTRLRIVLDNSPVHRNRQNDIEKRLMKAGCAVFRAHFRRMSHSKVIIRQINGKPTEVLTGSTNFSINSLFAQHNHVVVIRDAQTASIYEEYFNEAIASSSTSHKWISIEQDRLPAMRVLMCPSPDLVPAVHEALLRAKRSILYSLADSSKKMIFGVFDEEWRRSQQLLMGGVIHSSSGQQVLWGKTELSIRPDRERRQLTGTTTGATSGNGKFIVIDFDQPDAVVFAGSASFSEAGAMSNGDNLLEIHDPSIATQFAIEALQMIDHYRFLATSYKNEGELQLAVKDNWWRSYYSPRDMRSLERKILANALWTQKISPRKRRVMKPARETPKEEHRPVKRSSKSRPSMIARAKKK